jgi:hypothetical protein
MVNLLLKLIISLQERERKNNPEKPINIDNYQIIHKNLTIITLS